MYPVPKVALLKTISLYLKFLAGAFHLLKLFILLLEMHLPSVLLGAVLAAATQARVLGSVNVPRGLLSPAEI